MVSASGKPSVFPGFLPVADGSFLAYSCAAARDLHPLPCLHRAAKTRVPNEIAKNENDLRKKSNAWGGRSQSRYGSDLLSPPPYHIQQERKQHAHQDRSRERKIKSGVLA